MSFSLRRLRAIVSSAKGKEFSRKVRTLTGNYQLLRLAPWMLSPANPLLFRFVSHKLLRLLVPLLLFVMLITSAVAGGGFYRAVFGLASDFLPRGCPRHLESVGEEDQADRHRQHVCHAQCGGGAGVYKQLCSRAKRSVSKLLS